MRIALGADHRGFALKERLKRRLAADGHRVTDFGTDSEESCDYPDPACRVARAVAAGRAARGILICASGIGMSIAANRLPRVRAALCHDPAQAEMSRRHNNANVLCLGADVAEAGILLRTVRRWLTTRFEGGRHRRRVRKLDDCRSVSGSARRAR
ncbi:MAG TPA: ribose 5-phosphate isomerase B [candidate division WOR-3 bacterium]|uniref:Ribose 5-phosphate isomerase B n=1 Tax=candidate division WOR-3 bacterium TaxID=2052148 RepID=A0A7V0T7C5_UNCW3|nr:ribose 5-phosphate isomerase B [candidate division WOR-3 bacterium]